MTKKERLINWAKEKWENDKNRNINLEICEISYGEHDKKFATRVCSIGSFEHFTNCLNFYDDNLISLGNNTSNFEIKEEWKDKRDEVVKLIGYEFLEVKIIIKCWQGKESFEDQIYKW